METKQLLELAEQNKEDLGSPHNIWIMDGLRRNIRIMPPDEWKRVEALQEYIRTKTQQFKW